MTQTTVRILTTLAERAADPPDGQLLDRFVRTRDHAAFEALVRRHGPMVLGVCRRVLRSPADVDDAFQATFLVLARKAAALGTSRPLAGFLHAVAFNTARKLRHTNLRRSTRETSLAAAGEPVATPDPARDELFALLDEELSRLPDRYRVPIVLCDLQGVTRKDAAARLGWPEGTVAGRLSRGRARLAERLAARGVAPAAGVLTTLLAATTNAGQLPFGRGVTAGVASSRVAQLTEGVISTMFAKNLRIVAAVVLCAGLALAGAVGLSQSPVTAQPTPKPAEPKAAPVPPPKPGEGRGLTIHPLKKLDPEATAKVIADAYAGKGVTVSAVAPERLLLLYADAKATAEIRELLTKLGEERSQTPEVIRLAGVSAIEAAKSLEEVFNGPAGKQGRRITVVPLADANALIVFASPIDVLTARKLLEKSIAGEEAANPEPKRYAINFRNAPWADVLAWFAEESGLTPVYNAKPVGTATIRPPKDRTFTMGEVVDLLNETLILQKFILIRKQLTFTLHPTDQKLDPSLVPRIELSELPKRGKTELVQGLIPLNGLDGSDAVSEVQKLLSPFGSVAALAKLNTLVIVDAAGNVGRIHQTLRGWVEGTGDVLTHRLNYVKAREVADRLKTLLGDKYGKVVVAWDGKTNAVTVTGPPDKIALAKKLIEEIDNPQQPGQRPLTLPDPELRKYSVPSGSADAVAKALQTSYPAIRVLAIPTTNEVMVLGRPEEHVLVVGKLRELAGKK